MKNIKIVTISLALMTTSAFSDFTIKDLFVSGGTQSEENIKDGKNKDKKIRTHQDCI
jgi:hypothetical protein